MGLSWRVRFGYATGHVLNDLCASVWFTYTLVYFKFGVGVPTVLAGTVVLLGQVADGLATPLVGFFSDKSSFSGQAQAAVHYQRTPTGQESNGYTERTLYATDSTTELVDDFTVHSPPCVWKWLPRGRKAWHFVGSLLVITSFPLLFGSPFATHRVSTWAKMVYYSPIVILFQVGWAAVQITHLAMMNDLTLEPGERTLLTSFRYLFTVLSNLAVYLSTFFLLHHTPVDPEPHNGTEPLNFSGNPFRRPHHSVVGSHPLQNDVDFGVDDLPAFRILSLAIIAVGGLVTVIFHLCVRNSDLVIAPSVAGPTETTPLREAELEMKKKSSQEAEHEINSWRDWLHLPLFWVQGLFYMTVRLTVNVSQAYITVYLLHSLLLPKKTMALVPLTIYLTSMATLLVQKPVQDKISREFNSVIGMAFVIAFCIMVKFPGSPVILARVYVAAGILGIGCTIILITGLAMVSDLIGKNPENGAFVYGYMSFTDKLANGIVIQVVESLWNSMKSDRYYEDVESYGIGTIVGIGLVFLTVQTVVKWRTYGRISLFFVQSSIIQS
ncbi:Major facilitator superfamily domain-containing protein 12 [Fasciola gigantica]|uniref:Major facilitator superfamily domain-containing protein 12 n=1 Tax=Fasciola gigantica TaxID=46835 RepID=A0A504YY77_FASGI|nr:Major facilitator superfamily domain-containing protein 12 [Fasciola gigantica]